MAKQTKNLLATVLSLVICVSSLTLSSCDLLTGIISQPTTGVQTPDEGNKEELPSNPDEVQVGFEFMVNSSMHTDLQLAYLNDSYINIANYANGSTELSKPEPVKIAWKAVGAKKANNCKLTISENEDLSNAKTISVKTQTVEIYNLKVRTRYYYKMTGTLDGKTVTSGVKSFVTTSYLPRVIDVDGVTNVRDLGGYNVAGGVVKQGMVFRSGRLNESSRDTLKTEITTIGKITLEELGVKSEIDLRKTGDETGGLEGLTVGVLGEAVNYYHTPMTYANGPQAKENYQSIKQVYSYFANPDNYPIIYHCNIGTDRTGFISYTLNALLGVSQTDLYRDYLFSNFGNIGGSRAISSISGYVNAIDACAGKTLSEKAENYLKNTIGVPKSDLDSIKSILIEKHTYTDTVVTEATCEQIGKVLHTCLDNELLSWYEDTGFGEHNFVEVDGEKQCSVCGNEEVDLVVPAEYTFVDYIQSTGTEYIDSGYIPNNNTRVIAKMDFNKSSSTTSQNAFCAKGSSSRDKEFGFLCNSSGKYITRYADDAYIALSYQNKPFLIDSNKNIFSVDEEIKYTHEEREFSCDYSMYIFACNDRGSMKNPATMKLYYMQVYDNGVLVRNFVPCVRNADETAGLYDTVNENFYTNLGAGAFLYV